MCDKKAGMMNAISAITEGFWRFAMKRSRVQPLTDKDVLREQPITSMLDYEPMPSRIPYQWQPKTAMQGNLLAHGFQGTWDSLPLKHGVIPLIMQGGKPSAIMGARTPQRLTFAAATNPQRIPSVYVQNV